MCAVLNVPRSSFYYESNVKITVDDITDKVCKIFKESRSNYGTRKIKIELFKKNIIISRRRIRNIMRKKGLVSNYTKAQYKVHKQPANDEIVTNEVNREFDDRDYLEVVVSDLTYVRVRGKWNYVCILIDLFNREIIGFSAGPNKSALLVHQAFASIQTDLKKIKIFHTDRGREFKNYLIDDLIKEFKIKRSLSKKGCPYDNAVAEATFKIFKVEFAYQYMFSSLEQLKLELYDYVNWYNTIRIHSSLGYETPKHYKILHPKKVV